MAFETSHLLLDQNHSNCTDELCKALPVNDMIMSRLNESQWLLHHKSSQSMWQLEKLTTNYCTFQHKSPNPCRLSVLLSNEGKQLSDALLHWAQKSFPKKQLLQSGECSCPECSSTLSIVMLPITHRIFLTPKSVKLSHGFANISPKSHIFLTCIWIMKGENITLKIHHNTI